MDFLKNISFVAVHGELSRPILGLAIDSRLVQAGFAFIAIKGSLSDGHQFIETAIAKGATMVFYENSDLVSSQFIAENEATSFVKVESTQAIAGLLAANFYDHPSKKIKLVGITGTNGKTTTATLLYRLMRSLGYPTGLLSTVENRINDTIVPATHTTPDAINLQKFLREMVDAGCEFAFMEVSSHALDQQRTAGTQFVGGVFTNISHDHLDYHQTFQDYIYAKKKLFDNLGKNAFALVNLDDKRGEVMLQNCKAQKHTYALRTIASFKAKIIENTLNGLHLDLDRHDYYGRLIGEFNAYNTLAVYATAILLNLDKNEVLPALSNLQSAEGRFEYIKNQEKNIIGIVDYAHTPDALEKVLKTIEGIKGNGKVITVVGCGGNRDRTKRPIMAEIACDYSDKIILTSDNPRTENPLDILAEMQKGVPIIAANRVLTIENREAAIKTACMLAQNNDIILIAGKGHEKYQEINGIKHPFDDKMMLQQQLIP